jgi:hypothetical protein
MLVGSYVNGEYHSLESQELDHGRIFILEVAYPRAPHDRHEVWRAFDSAALSCSSATSLLDLLPTVGYNTVRTEG